MFILIHIYVCIPSIFFKTRPQSHRNVIITTQLGTKLKTHKAARLVVPRTIHKNLGSAFTGVPKWLSSVIDPALMKIEHYCKDSFEFKQRVENCAIVLPSTVRLVTVDLKDFYLSGDWPELARDASSSFDPARASLLHDAISFLLQLQYIIATGME